MVKVTDWWEADQEAIKEAQEALDEFNKEQELDALEKQKDEAIKNIDDQIDAWEKYKESWKNVADDYETQQARMTLAQQLGADAEAKILQQRLDVLEDYKSKYLATMKEITNLENTPSDKLNGYNTPKDTNNWVFSSHSTYHISITNNTDKVIKGIQGVLDTQDMFGVSILKASCDLTGYEIQPGETYIDKDMSLEINEFMSDHTKIYNTDFKDLKSVLYIFVWSYKNI